MDTDVTSTLGQDVTPSVVAEKRDLLTRLLARLAHEIRNPLSSLDIHIQLLEEDLATLAPQVREQMTARLEVIQGELHRLDGIVAQFLRLAGPSALDLEPVDLREVLKHVCDLLRPEAKARGVEIRNLCRDPLPSGYADPVRLTQALMNLVINAIQAVEGGGCVEVVAESSGDSMVVAIRDTGPGIPEDNLAAIFEPYFSTKSQGHGLGLWITQQIISAHGGSLRVANRVPSGAVFTVAIPWRSSPGTDSSRSPATPA